MAQGEGSSMQVCAAGRSATGTADMACQCPIITFRVTCSTQGMGWTSSL